MKPNSSITTFLMLFALTCCSSSFAFDPNDAAANLQYIHPGATIKTPAAAFKATGQMDVPTFHSGTTLYCSQCHVMHASQQHAHEGVGAIDPFGPYPRTFDPSPKLLKAPDPVALCLTCHDNVPGVPDVVGADVNGLVERSAGLFELPGEPNPRGHKLDYGLDTDPGFGLCMRCHFGGTFEDAAVSCIDCHNPHGNGRARNLQWASYPGGEPQFGLYNSVNSGLAKYERGNVAYGTDNSDLAREVTNMCNDCHHVFTGQYYNDPDADGIHNLHPSYDSERSNPNNIAQGNSEGTTSSQHWIDGTGTGYQATPRVNFVNYPATDFASASTVNAGSNGVFCLSCHKAHGGTSSFALLWDPVGSFNGEGCDQCHLKMGE